MMPRAAITMKAVSVTIAFGLLTAACSSDNSPEAQIPDGPLVPTASLKYAASDPTAAASADSTCKDLGQTAKLDKTDGGVQVFKCQ